MKIITAKNMTYPFVRRFGTKLAKAAIREVVKTKPGKHIKRLFELEDIAEKRPSRIVSGVLGTADKVVNLAVRPLKKRKKRSWRHMYEHKYQKDKEEGEIKC